MSHKSCYLRYELSVKEVSTTRATFVKPRWYLSAFGHGWFPSEMKMRDIKEQAAFGGSLFSYLNMRASRPGPTPM